MEEKLKPKSFRIDDEVANRIKLITNEIGGNQQEAFAKMIESYEFQKGKAKIIGRKEDVEKFESHITILTRMFMNVLEDGQNITATVKSEFEALLVSKDTTIADLQAKTTEIKELKEGKSNLETKLNEILSSTTDNEKRYNLTLKDKEELNTALLENCKEQRKQIETLTNKIGSALENENKIIDFKNDITKLENNLTEFTKHYDAEKNLAETKSQQEIQTKELEFERKLIQLEKAYQTQIKEIERAKIKEIDSYQQKYLMLLETINAKQTKKSTKKEECST